MILKPVRAIKHISPLRSKTSAVYINAKAVEIVSQMITEDLEETIQKDSSFKTFKISERVFKCLEAGALFAKICDLSTFFRALVLKLSY